MFTDDKNIKFLALKKPFWVGLKRELFVHRASVGNRENDDLQTGVAIFVCGIG